MIKMLPKLDAVDQLTLLYARTPKTDKDMPKMFMGVTGFLSKMRDTVMMEIRLEALATA